MKRQKLFSILFIFLTMATMAMSKQQLDPQVDEKMFEFIEWASMFGKNYSTQDEFNKRFTNYLQVDAEIKKAISSGAVKETTLGHNKFSDQSDEDMGGHSSKFDIKMAKISSSTEQNMNVNVSNRSSGYNARMNWCSTNRNACNAIVDQERKTCVNAGGAFATIAAIESQWKIQTDKLVKLSEQQCLDCAYTVNEGCATGQLPDKCLDYAQNKKAINLNENYMLTNKNQTCYYSAKTGPALISESVSLTPQNATVIKRQLDTNVVIATIDSSCILFKNYKSDIISTSCTSEVVTNHTILIVGHGTYIDQSNTATNYFILRNSWGTDWGVDGYMRLSYDDSKLSDGILGVQQAPKYLNVVAPSNEVDGNVFTE